ncbi:MAG TPA: hypothetical protein VL460_07715 [Caulobacteraceae bacterium]|nr:hypothetical protein [Caulobacteraceae bacterium]
MSAPDAGGFGRRGAQPTAKAPSPRAYADKQKEDRAARRAQLAPGTAVLVVGFAVLGLLSVWHGWVVMMGQPMRAPDWFMHARDPWSYYHPSSGKHPSQTVHGWAPYWVVQVIGVGATALIGWWTARGRMKRNKPLGLVAALPRVIMAYMAVRGLINLIMDTSLYLHFEWMPSLLGWAKYAIPSFLAGAAGFAMELMFGGWILLVPVLVLTTPLLFVVGRIDRRRGAF